MQNENVIQLAQTEYYLNTKKMHVNVRCIHLILQFSKLFSVNARDFRFIARYIGK